MHAYRLLLTTAGVPRLVAAAALSRLTTSMLALEEETGLRARLGAVVGVFSQWYTAQESVRGEAGHVIGVVYDATSVTGELRTSFDEGTTDAATWLTARGCRMTPCCPRGARTGS